MFKVGLYFFHIFNKFAIVNHLAFGKICVLSNFIACLDHIFSLGACGGDEA